MTSRMVTLGVYAQALFTISLLNDALPFWFALLTFFILTARAVGGRYVLVRNHLIILIPYFGIVAANPAFIDATFWSRQWLQLLCASYLALSFLTPPNPKTLRRVLLVCLLGVGLLLTEDSSNLMLMAAFLNVGVVAILFFMLAQERFVELSMAPVFRTLIRVSAQTLPFILVIFVVLPQFARERAGGSSQSRTGLSDTVQPGQIERLAQSWELAFKVQLAHGASVARSDRYWRSAVLEQGRGLSWRRNRQQRLSEAKERSPVQISSGTVQSYAVQPVILPYLPSLGLPLNLLPGGDADRIRLTTKGTIISRDFVNRAMHYQMNASTGLVPTDRPRIGPPKEKELGHYSEQVQELARILDTPQRGPVAMLVRIMNHFSINQFRYTLSPGLTKSLDHFLFDKRQGFCEHFAASTASLLQIRGYSARLIAGFHGGETVADARTIEVYSRDAHTWLEVWDPQRNRWHHGDPTAIVAPERIALGGQRYFSWIEFPILEFFLSDENKDTLWLLYKVITSTMEEIGRTTNLWIDELFLQIADLLALGPQLAIFSLVVGLAMTIFWIIRSGTFSRRGRLQRRWQRFEKILRAQHMNMPTSSNVFLEHETPFGAHTSDFVRDWLEARYGPPQRPVNWSRMDQQLVKIARNLRLGHGHQ